jgi:hypothetical protein
MGESTFRRYVQILNLNTKTETYLPLHFNPGEAAQADWVEVKVNVAGELLKLDVLSVVLAYSYRIYASIMPSQKDENFIAGLVSAFESFGGVPEKIFFDNTKNAVFKYSGSRAIMQEKFQLFSSHYGFTPLFMNSGKGNEKGSVENLCKTVAKRILPKIPAVNKISEVQDIILSRTTEYNATHKIKNRKNSVNENFMIEKPYLKNLPIKSYDKYITKTAVVDSKQLFQFETNKYSVPEWLVKKTITLRVYPYYIEVWYGGNIITKHDRIVDKYQVTYVIEHYLNALESKIRAWNNAAPLLFGETYNEIKIFREKCKEENIGEKIMLLYQRLKAYGVELTLSAVSYANSKDNPTLDDVDDFIKFKKTNMIVKDLNDSNDSNEDLSQYNSLIPNNNNEKDQNE